MNQIEQRVEESMEDRQEFVTVKIAGQLFGIPVHLVHDVFVPQSITKVPLAGEEIGGVLNLRGRIVTAIDVGNCLGLPPREEDAKQMAVCIEKSGESYGLVIDSVGEVLRMKAEEFERNPANLDKRWRAVSKGVYRLEGELLIILDVDQILDFGSDTQAA